MISQIKKPQPLVSVKKVDTSYGANLAQPSVQTLQPKITSSASVVNGVDTSYAANMQQGTTTPTTKAASLELANVDKSYGANIGRLVTPISTVKTKKVLPSRLNTQQSATEVTPTAETPTEQPATETSTPLTYEQFIAQQNAAAQSNLDSQKALIEQQKQDAITQAENERERSTVDARSSYAQNLATYGANAETLGGMGLSGSGYGDYINAQAYAQQRADIQQANAQSQTTKQQAESLANQQNLEAQTQYQDYVAQNDEKLFAYQEQKRQEEEQKALTKNNTYAELLNGINSGAYTAEQAGTLADTYELDATQRQSLIDAANKYQTDKYNAGNAQIASGIANGEVDKSTLDAALSSDLISQEQYNTHLNTYQTQNYDDFMLDIKSQSGYSQDELQIQDDIINSIEIAVKNGDISQEQYASLKAEWNNKIDTGDNAFSGFNTYQDAKTYYEKKLNNAWISDEKKAALKTAFEKFETKCYASNVSSGMNSAGSTVTLNTPYGKHTVTYGIDKHSLDKDSDNILFASDTYKNAGSGQVFLVDGKVYVKLDNGDLGRVNDYLGQGAFEALKNAYSGTVYDIDSRDDDWRSSVESKIKAKAEECASVNTTYSNASYLQQEVFSAAYNENNKADLSAIDVSTLTDEDLFWGKIYWEGASGWYTLNVNGKRYYYKKK